MNDDLAAVIAACEAFGKDRTRLLDIAREVQQRFGCVPQAAIDAIASALGMPRVEVESAISFYTFLSVEPKGAIVIRLCDDVIDRLAGVQKVAEALEAEAGVPFGQTTPDCLLSLQWTACIGMSDQAPAALVNDTVVTELTPGRAREMVQALRQHRDPKRLVHRVGDGNNAHPLVRAMVMNNIRRTGPVILTDTKVGEGLQRAVAMSPIEVIRTIKAARLRGRGGAGFPTGLKWEFTRSSPGERKYVLCNADEGEPGTFKDRVILTEKPELVFEGMAIAGYAIGADTGYVYLRGEYAYLKPFLEDVLDRMRSAGLLGSELCGRSCLSFDIQIRLGAGAYVCGEETALISSLEGRRGDPKTRPPFPAQKGFLGQPSVVNNVETFCCATRIMEMGAAWFSQFGRGDSAGTKLLSVSGDCLAPGVYEVPFGLSLRELLREAGAPEAGAVQVGGPSGRLVGPQDFDRTISFEELATGGSVMVFSPERDVLEIVRQFMRFFVHESCGYCTPCRVGNTLLLQRIERILAGQGEEGDLDYLRSLGESVRTLSRCGLGQTSPNPILTSLEAFPEAYASRLRPTTDRQRPSFDLASALRASDIITGRLDTPFASGSKMT